ncbi:hypothetical protein CRYUN_Cryun31cG0105600 [Craigia yunnanensis]
MDTNNWRPTLPSGEPTMDTDDWRTKLQSDSRQRIVNKIMDTLKRHLPFSGQEGLHELRKIAVRFEEKVFTAAFNQSDYLRIISLKMLTMETKSRNIIPNTGNNSNPPDPGSQGTQSQLHSEEANRVSGDLRERWQLLLQPESRQRIVTKIMDTLKRHLSFQDQGLNELRMIAVRFEERIYATATCQSDYLRRIALKMLSMESRSPTVCIGAKRKRVMAPPQ